MYRLSCHITIGKLIFNYINEVVIDSSWKNFTDTCSIRLPRNLKLKQEKLQDIIKRRDKVVIKLGYDDILITEFVGYVTNLKPSIPIEITCEDEMYALKKGPVSLSYKKITLPELIKAIAPGYEYKVFDADLGSFLVQKATPAQVLEKIKESYGLNSFFRISNDKPVLHVGVNYTDADAQTYIYKFQDNVVGNNLEFKSKEDMKLKVKAISIMPDNKKIEVEVGDTDGEERTLNFYNVPEKSLKELADKEIEKMKYDGYRGSIIVFGTPTARSGDKAEIRDQEYPERDGTYHIEGVKVTFGINGYRREVILGQRV